MQEFDRHPLVEKMLVINRPISWAEVLFMRRNWKPRTGKVVFQEDQISINQVSSKTYTLDILIREFVRPIVMRRRWIPYVFSHSKVLEGVRIALTHLNMSSSYRLFMSAPLFVPLIQQLLPSVYALDAQDNLLKHILYRNLPRLEEYYQFCIETADVLSANSEQTVSWFKQYRDDVLHIPNGVDDTFFTHTHSFTPPADMSSIRSPVVGYAGKMQELFDVALMIEVVNTMPDVNFVFIGQELNPKWMKPLWSYPNTYYLGDKPYSMLPQYLASFDVCIIPYAKERQHGGDPIKFYEYLAMGKPIVTTNIGNVGVFKDFPQVFIAETRDQFINGLINFVNQIRTHTPIPISPIPNSCLWRTKADKIIKALRDK